MSLRDEVRATLNALCENAGVSEDEDGDYIVRLGDCPACVRAYEKPVAIAVFCTVATNVPYSPEVNQFVNDVCRSYVLFRIFWEDEELILRADLIASPFVPQQLQAVLESFDDVAEELASEAAAWSKA